MDIRISILVAFLLGVAVCHSEQHDDLVAEESSIIESRTFVVLDRPSHNRTKYSSRISSSKNNTSTEIPYGLKLSSHKTSSESADHLVNRAFTARRRFTATTEKVLDFRISDEYSDYQNNEVAQKEAENSPDMRVAAAGNAKQKKETSKKDDDEEEKTLAQQVADGKYGLIQNELFSNGSKRPGILSYLSNSEVPRDTKANLGGLDKEEIWLAEDHLLVLRGGRYPEGTGNNGSVWPPIDDYEAPPRQVKIPENPKIPPPFPIQLSDNGPVEFVSGENGTSGPPPFIPGPYPPPFPFPPPNGSLPFPYPGDEFPNRTFPFPPGPLPPFLANLPPGAAFLPPPGNFTDFDEDDPSIYYPPKYDFYYHQDNSTAVPPGPLVPGIILPPPPDFFAPFKNGTGDGPRDEENETDHDDSVVPNKPQFLGPGYLPAERRPVEKQRVYPKRPPVRIHTTTPSYNGDISNHIPESSPSPGYHKPGVTYVYPENPSKTTSRPTYRVPSEENRNKFTSPIYVPSQGRVVTYHPLPTTSPKPNHITIPAKMSLSQEIYIVSTPTPGQEDKNTIKDIYKEPKTKVKLEDIRPEVHPLRSLIKPNVTVSYVGKYGHLPASTPFPFPKLAQENRDVHKKPYRGGHYITKATPTKVDIVDNVINTDSPHAELSHVTVTPVPIVKKIRVRPVLPDKTGIDPTSSMPPKATYYFYEEMTTEAPSPDIKTTTANPVVIETTKEIIEQYPESLTSPRTPVRQFLEETFHASNVLQNKPQIIPVGVKNTALNGIYTPDSAKMKHLYGPAVRQKPLIRYHYITQEDPVIIPKPKIKLLEIENPGVSGIKSIGSTTPAPFSMQQFTTYRTPEKINQMTLGHPTTTPSSATDGPFIPSNYYATARPDDVHFTPQDHSMIDDITKNYFTIFGQKINSASTTPLVPVTTHGNHRSPSKLPPSSGLSFVPDTGNEFQINQVHSTPSNPTPVPFTTDRPKYLNIITSTQRPPSHFEQYLKELTGEDQKDFIVSEVAGTKTKKGKANFAVQIPSAILSSPEFSNLPHQIQAPGPVYIAPVREPGLSQYLEEVRTGSKPGYDIPPRYPYEGFMARPKVHYRPNYSTTLRPVMNVEIQPQYIQQISSTYRPYETRPVLPPYIRSSHNLGQYLHEISSFSSPTTISPIKVKRPQSNLQYFPSTPSPLGFRQHQYAEAETKPPISLEGDILVNYKEPRPEINPEAEIINVHPPPFSDNSNFRIVDPPDLGNQQNRGQYRRPYPANRKPKPQQDAKDFFENLPNSGYFSPPHQGSGNSFISYNLPGNGGHFYFLTPQVMDRNDGDAEEFKRRRSDEYAAVATTREQDQRRPRQNVQRTDQEDGSEYRRRRRKKP